MDVYVRGNKVRLTQAEFRAQGGEGAVYVRGDTAYKIYADPAKMIPPAKIRELSVLSLPDIIRPQDVILDRCRVPLGYTMRSVPDGFVLCQTFPRAFRERMGLTPGTVFRLVRKLQEGVQHVHAQGLLLVDLNEMNFLVDSQFGSVYFIDVDSYQTRNFAATALMESVRDRHARGFSPGTDWFAFAVVSFQMFVGVHPYKGKHATLRTLEERMSRNVSVLNPAVSVPPVCLPLDVIPKAYQDWYRAVLERGERVAPPHPARPVLVLPTRTPRHTGDGPFDITKVLECAGTIISFTHGVTVTTEGIYRDSQRCGDAGANVRIALTPGRGHAARASLDAGALRLFDLTAGQEIAAEAAGEQITATGGRVYVKQGASLLELDFLETPHGCWPRLRAVGAVLEQATQLFEGVAFQNLFGAWYASLLPRRGLCRQVRLPELDGFQVLDARFQGGVLMVVAAHEGRFQKFVFRFDADAASHDTRLIADLHTPDVNFVVLDHGICLHLNDEDALEVFPARRGAAGMQVISDAALGGDCRLLSDGTQALFARGSALYQFTMR